MSEELLPISVQLYSLREAAAADFPAVLRRLGDIGFIGVELAGFHGLSTAEFNTIASDSGLIVSSGHVGDATPDALNAALDDLQAVGANTAVLAFLPPSEFADLAAIQRNAELINRANEIATGRGVTFGYHNHWWEFETQIDGRSAWSHLWELLDPSVAVELDIYWTTIGGADPIEVIAAAGERLALLHVKDGPADEPGSPMVAVGSGTLDIPAILAAGSSAAWHVVELDRCATDMFAAIEASYGYLVGSELSRGRK